MRCCPSFLAVLLLATAIPISAQDFQPPAGWIAKADDPAADLKSTLAFAAMPPGWHVTTGPAVILYDPALAASGSFRVEAETYRFPGESSSGVGFFLGGRDLAGAAPSYFAFLIDRDGGFELYHQTGDTVHIVSPRSVHPAIVPWTEGTADNVLAAEVRPDSIRLLVNDQLIAAYARAPYMDFDGNVGLRVGGDVDLHVTRLDVLPLAAPGN